MFDTDFMFGTNMGIDLSSERNLSVAVAPADAFRKIVNSGDFSEVLKVHGGEVEVIGEKTTDGMDFFVRFAGEETSHNVGRMIVEKEGVSEIVSFEGFFGREINSFFLKKGIKVSRFYISEDVMKNISGIDEYAIYEFRNFFSQISEGKGVYTSPTQIIFENETAKTLFYEKGIIFSTGYSNSATSELSKNTWNGAKDREQFFDYSVDSSVQGGTFKPLPLLRLNDASISLDEGFDFAVRIEGMSPSGNPEGKTSHRIMTVRQENLHIVSNRCYQIRYEIAQIQSELVKIDEAFSGGLIQFESAWEKSEALLSKNSILQSELSKLINEYNLRFLGEMWASNRKRGAYRVSYDPETGFLKPRNSGKFVNLTIKVDNTGRITEVIGGDRNVKNIFTFTETYVKRNSQAINISIESSSKVYSGGIDVFAISHIHADHFNPSAVLEQIKINTLKGIRTTLLLSNDVEDGVVRLLAEADGIKSERALDYLVSKYNIVVTGRMDVNGLTFEMLDNPYASHGPEGSRFRVTRPNGTIDYLYTGDGDFNLESINKRIGEVREVRRLRAGEIALPSIEQKLLLKKYETLNNAMLNFHEEKLIQTRNDLIMARFAEVDEGKFNGTDTHGNQKTIESIRRTRLNKFPKLAEQLGDDFSEFLRLASLEDEQGMRQLLAKRNVESEIIDAVIGEVKSVRPTHDFGYGAESGVSEIREGRVQQFSSSSVKIQLPKLMDELVARGARIACAGKAKLVIQFGDEIIEIVDNGISRNALRQLIQDYSYSVVDTETNMKIPKFALEGLRVNGENAIIINENVATFRIISNGKNIDLPLEARDPLPVPGSGNPQTSKYIYEIKIPKSVENAARRAGHEGLELLKALKNIISGKLQEFGATKKLVEWASKIISNPQLFEKFLSFIVSSPKVMRAVGILSKVGKVFGKVLGPACIVMVLAIETYERGGKLVDGDAGAWSKTAGNIMTVGIGFLTFALDAPITLGMWIVQGENFDAEHYFFPMAQSLGWASEMALRDFHGLPSYGDDLDVNNNSH